jgi:NAD(P)-dependent dehydrogenase (short-subunit alcohol dehydrogenase family)
MTEPKVALITGASSGVGKGAALILAAQGWRIIGTGRDAARLAAAEAEIAAVASAAVASAAVTKPALKAPVTMIAADLSLMHEVERLAAEVIALTPRLDLLANNAGGMAAAQAMTAEGLEANFAGNHLAPVFLTERLLSLLRAGAAGRPPGSVRIVNTSSDASEMIVAVDLADIQGLADGSAGGVYCRGKLGNVVHARALAQELAGDGIVAHAFHPGTVASNFFAGVSAQTRAYTDTLDKISETEGGDTLAWLATAEEPGRSSGGYWYRRAPRTPNPLVADADFVVGFQQASAALIAQALRA